MSSQPLPRWRSLRLRLPLLISTLVIIVIGAFLWATNRELEQALRRAGSDRAQAAADQMSALMTQAVTRGVNEARRIAGGEVVRQYLLDPSDDRRAAEQALLPLAAAAQPPVELWNEAGTRVLQVASPRGKPAAEDIPVALRAGFSPFRVSHNVVVYNLIAEVNDSAPPAVVERRSPPAPPRRLGYVVIRRTLATAQASETISRLVGSGALVAIGNQTDGVWTNFSKPVPAPPFNATRNGVSDYRNAAGDRRLAAVSVIPGTPWAVLIEFPYQGAIAPARAVLRRMLLFGAIFVVLAAITAGVVSARITTPLHELTSASEAVAEGQLSKRVRAMRNDEIGRLGAAFNAMSERIEQAHNELEARVEERTAGLRAAVEELEAFSYSVSHDLRAPLRSVIGFSTLLEEASPATLGDEGRRHVKRIVTAATRMAQLIDDLLAFSRVSRAKLAKGPVDLNQVVREAQKDVVSGGVNGHVEWRLGQLPIVNGDPALLRLAFVNLLSNAAKYSSKCARPEIEVGAATSNDTETVVFVRDNGVGFDMQYADKLFGVFQRLHGVDEFEGTGIGLANVHRIVQRHGGRTWAEGVVNGGATFYFSLPFADAPAS